MEILLSTLHITGMIVFVFTEVYDGQCHIPALDPVGHHCYSSVTSTSTDHSMMIRDHQQGYYSNYKFNLYHITYYWFGFWFCNMIWGIIPIIRIIRSILECQRAIQYYNQNHTDNTIQTTSNNTNGTTTTTTTTNKKQE